MQPAAGGRLTGAVRLPRSQGVQVGEQREVDAAEADVPQHGRRRAAVQAGDAARPHQLQCYLARRHPRRLGPGTRCRREPAHGRQLTTAVTDAR